MKLYLDVIFIILEKKKRSIRERILGNLIFRAAQNRWLRGRAPENCIFVKSYLCFFNLKSYLSFFSQPLISVTIVSYLCLS